MLLLECIKKTKPTAKPGFFLPVFQEAKGRGFIVSLICLSVFLVGFFFCFVLFFEVKVQRGQENF